MSNKQMEKIPVNKEAFMNILKSKGLSLRGLDRDENFKGSDKTLRRGLNAGEMTIRTIKSLAEYLNVDASEFAQIKIKEEVRKSSVKQSIVLDLNRYDVDIIIKDNKMEVVWKLKNE